MSEIEIESKSMSESGGAGLVDEVAVERELVRVEWVGEESWTRQSESSLIPPFSLEELMVAAEMEMEGDEGRAREERGFYMAARRVLAGRERELAEMVERPLTRCWVPDDFWIILRELCRMRVENPGDVLVLWLSGGIRSGKSFLLAWLSVCH
jgi:hypothetical protein